MLRALIKKYGLVPKIEFNESYHTSNSNDMNDILKKVLRILNSISTHPTYIQILRHLKIFHHL